jgi:hypothetical protein
MALQRVYNLGGGGNLVVTPPNPVELATKLAELAAKQQAPGFEQQRVDIERANALRAAQALAAQTEQGKKALEEEARYHTGTLAETAKGREANILSEQNKLAATVGESAADRAARASIEADRLKAGKVSDVLSHLAPTLAQTPGALNEVLTRMGMPEVGAGMEAARVKDVTTRAGQSVAGLKKPEDVSKTIELLPKDPVTGKPDPLAVNAAWNAYKTANPSVLGPPPPPAPETAPVTGGPPPVAGAPAAPGGATTEGVGWRSTPLSTTGTPGLVKTEDRGLVKPSMGLVGEGGNVLPIPGATPGLYAGGEVPAAAPATTPTVAGAAPTIGQRFGALVAGEGTTPAPAVAATPAPPTFDIDVAERCWHSVYGRP